VEWSEPALGELDEMYYPLETKEKIFRDSFKRLSFMPTASAKRIVSGELEGYWSTTGLYQITLIFELDEENGVVWIEGIKHKRQDLYWKR
jgi:hypothetical protein